jgi:hypothetical protein
VTPGGAAKARSGDLMYYAGRLADVLDGFREAARNPYEAGAYFEELIAKFLTSEARYRDLYARVLPYLNWARQRGLDARDTKSLEVADRGKSEPA